LISKINGNILGEQNTRADQISLQIETLSKQFQTFLANQIAGKDLGSHSKGILHTPTMDNQEGMLPRGRSHIPGDRTGSQEHQRVVNNTSLPRMNLTSFWGENPRGWLRKCMKFFKLNSTLS